ncbi:MAG: cob(I)yrinic acid a,c-diamide adenosyltransferase, partial [Ruthenibacterium sp.]
MERGQIHLYYGDGKGKTTAAMGLALRAAGSGKRVVIVQFLKDGTSHEIQMLQKLPQVRVFCGKVCEAFAWN